MPNPLRISKIELQRLKTEEDLLKNLKEANSVACELQNIIKTKSFFDICLFRQIYFLYSFSYEEKGTNVDKLQAELQPKSLVIEELNRIVREKENALKNWEEHCMKSVAAHEKEKQGLESHLIGRKTYLGTIYDTSRRYCLLTNVYSFYRASDKK